MGREFDWMEHESFMLKINGALATAMEVLREDVAGSEADGLAVLDLIADELAGRALFLPGMRVQCGLLGQELKGTVVNTCRDGVFFKVDGGDTIIGLPSNRIELEGADIQHREWGDLPTDVAAQEAWRCAHIEARRKELAEVGMRITAANA